MIPDRIIEQGTLRTTGDSVAVEVRLPWYRALPASSVSEAALAIDGVAVPTESLRWEMNGRSRPLADLASDIEDWWFPTDSVVLSGALPVSEGEHTVEVDLKLYIPYIVTDHGVLRIEERDTKTMTAVTR